MRGVAEDVEEGHGLRGEAVDEECFDLALDEVEDGHVGDEGLEGGDGGGGDGAGVVGVEVGTEEVENDGVDEERAEVFDYEDGTPGDLRS